jgi:hypothetical protein
MSIDFDEEFDLLKALREAQALEAVRENEDGTWETKVVPDHLANLAAKEIVQLRQEVNELRNRLAKVKS